MDIEQITRGQGVTLLRIASGFCGGSFEPAFSVATASGQELPWRFDRIGVGQDFMLTVPTMEVPVIIRDFSTADANGPHSDPSFTLDPRKAKNSSRWNTFVRPDSSKSMRTLSDETYGRESAIVVDTIIDFKNEEKSILRGKALISGTNETLFEEIRWFILDGKGDPLNYSEPMILGDLVTERKGYKGEYTREISFSVSVPQTLAPCVLWLQTETHSHDLFHSFEAGSLERIRQEFVERRGPADRDPRYQSWFRERQATVDELEVQTRTSSRFSTRFSLIVPLYETPLTFLEEMVESVLGQSYGNLELILVNGSPENEILSRKIEGYAAADPRIKLVSMDENKGIVENTNAGIAVASGDFLVFVDHDDVLEPDALFWYADAVDRYPQTDLIYCDEDKLVEGIYQGPFFKPDWNLDLLRSMNYVCHMLAVRKSVVDSLEPSTREYDGAQDYHMTFRVAERARNIFHVRRVLYHWRLSEASVAQDPETKPYTSEVGRRVIQEHLDRCGIDATVRMSDVGPNRFSLDYHLPSHPLVSIVIPTKDYIDVLDGCLDSIFSKTTYDNFEIVLVENNSEKEETFEYYHDQEHIHDNLRTVIFDAKGEVNVSKAINIGVSHAKGDYVLILNNDTEVITPDWIERLLGPCMREDVGIVGAKLLYPDGVIQHAGIVFNHGLPENIGKNAVSYDSNDYFDCYQLTQDAIGVTAACAMVAKSVFEEVGGFPEDLPTAYDDVDFCLKVIATGRLIIYEPSVELYHYETVSRGKYEGQRDLATAVGYMMQKYPDYFIASDPFSSPHLRGVSRSLAFGPEGIYL